MSDILFGLVVAIIGMSVVFLLLILLVYIISLIKYIFRVPEPSAPETVKGTETVASAISEASYEQEGAELDEELAAVIASAIAAGLDTSTSNIVIRSIRRVDDKIPAWSEAGLHEAISINR